MGLDLRGYQSVVLLHWREFRSSAEYPWDALCDALNGRGVHSVDEALIKLRLRPIHEALRQAISVANVYHFSEIAAGIAAKPAPSAAKKTLSSESKPEDDRLRGFLESCQRSYERIAEQVPAEIAEAVRIYQAQQVEEFEALDAAQFFETQPPTHPWEQFKQDAQSMAAAALRLPHLERNFSTAWPPAVRHVLPSLSDDMPLEQAWAPVLAWIVLRNLPVPGSRAAVFDRLHLRQALAEIFSSMGIEGDQTWRMAARIRVLLMQTDQPQAAINAESFWQDPDVRWLTGVNQHSGKTYFNKELFEELLCWVQLPALLEAARQPQTDLRSIARVEAVVSRAYRAAKTAGYNLKDYLQQWSELPIQTAPAANPETPPSLKRKPAK
jgi:hypothetical protein